MCNAPSRAPGTVVGSGPRHLSSPGPPGADNSATVEVSLDRAGRPSPGIVSTACLRSAKRQHGEVAVDGPSQTGPPAGRELLASLGLTARLRFHGPPRERTQSHIRTPQSDGPRRGIDTPSRHYRPHNAAPRYAFAGTQHPEIWELLGPHRPRARSPADSMRQHVARVNGDGRLCSRLLGNCTSCETRLSGEAT